MGGVIRKWMRLEQHWRQFRFATHRKSGSAKTGNVSTDAITVTGLWIAGRTEVMSWIVTGILQESGGEEKEAAKMNRYHF